MIEKVDVMRGNHAELLHSSIYSQPEEDNFALHVKAQPPVCTRP